MITETYFYTYKLVKIFSGSSHLELATNIADSLGTELGKVELKKFSCGERYVRYIESVRSKDVYIVQTGTNQSSEDLIELYLMCQAAKLGFAKSIHVILPHFPYARQDRVAAPREPISAKLIASLLETSGADHVITLDLHSDQIQGFFSIPVDSLDARPVFAEYFNRKNLQNAVVVSPDAGGAKRAKKFGDLIGADLAIMHKSRPEHNQAEIVEVVGDIEGRTCILFDDIIDTAGSLVSAKNALVQRGAAPDVYAAATHGVFSGPAIERLNDANFKEVVVTNSMPHDEEKFSTLNVLPIAPLLAEVIQNVSQGKSVTEIYGSK